MSTPLLSVRDLHVSYGPIRALRGLDLTVHAGETVAIVGAWTNRCHFNALVF